MTAPRRVESHADRLAVLVGALLINLGLAAMVFYLVTPRDVDVVSRRVTQFVEFVRLVPTSQEFDPKQRDTLPPPPAAPTRAPTLALPKAAPPAAASASAQVTAAADTSLPALVLSATDDMRFIEQAIGPRPAGSDGAVGAHLGAGNGIGSGVGTGAGTDAQLQLRSEDVEINLTPSYKSSPSYPLRALKEGIEGVVTVEFVIDVDGDVREPRILHAEPPGLFDEAVLKALPKWKFSPKLVNGRAVERRARQDVVFRLHRQ